MRKVQRGMHFISKVTQGAIGAYGSLKALQAIGGEVYAGAQMARTLAAGASMAAPLALAL